MARRGFYNSIRIVTDCLPQTCQLALVIATFRPFSIMFSLANGLFAIIIELKRCLMHTSKIVPNRRKSIGNSVFARYFEVFERKKGHFLMLNCNKIEETEELRIL